ncbi:MAG TPA: hypothetical protein PK706_25375, partial [Xanthobacteraceae bacterium]|nr:hypothetical protein [Xanthobacteraceae bacterium]
MSAAEPRRPARRVRQDAPLLPPVAELPRLRGSIGCNTTFHPRQSLTLVSRAQRRSLRQLETKC